MRRMSKYNPAELQYAFYGLSNRKGIYMNLEKSEEHADKKPKNTTVRFPGAYAYITPEGSVDVDPEKGQKVWNDVQEEEYRDARIAYIMRNVFLFLAITALVAMFPLIFVSEYLPSTFAREYLPSICVSISWIYYGLSKVTPIIIADWKFLIGDKEVSQVFRFHQSILTMI